jgi:hypothetical protein
LGRVDEALRQHRRAKELQPDYAEACFSESLAQLSQGDFGYGWENYEARWRTKEQTTMREYAQPFWTGETLKAGRLLIWGEQGLGDEVMFAGLLPEVMRSGNRCVLDCDRRLAPLLTRSFPGLEVLSDEPELGEIAAHLPMGSLPKLFRTSHGSFAATTSRYLAADPGKRERFRAGYGDGRRLGGLAWHTKNRKTGRARSIDLALFEPLWARSDIRWVSLQYGDHKALEDQVATAQAAVLVDRSVDQLSDVDGFAAQIAAMDMVVTIDNSTAHLAGALGVPVWLLLPFAPDWRWLQGCDSSPWYPSMRVFRQRERGDWRSVMQEVDCALALENFAHAIGEFAPLG